MTEGLPLRIRHRGTEQSLDTGVKVTEADIVEAIDDAMNFRIVATLFPHAVADALREKFSDDIRAAIDGTKFLEGCSADDWLIQGGELTDAIQRLSAEKLKRV